MKKELQLFFTALTFYTRIPVPKRFRQNPDEYLAEAIRYLPVIGWVAGTVASFVYIGSSYLFGQSIAVLMSITASVLLTGAFHEDGFADVCDGFGGGWTKERILEIMKDSRVGAFGLIGLILLTGLKFTALIQVLPTGVSSLLPVVLILVTAHSISRFAPIIVMFIHPYARVAESKSSSAVRKAGNVNLIAAGSFCLLPLILSSCYFTEPLMILLILPPVAMALYLGRYFHKWIGGYTGDCLGAVQQITELLIYLSFIAIWKFI
jgi:adenosylcobinamide-GDP ribazoletransferase